jgi:hypothetical protein
MLNIGRTETVGKMIVGAGNQTAHSVNSFNEAVGHD